MSLSYVFNTSFVRVVIDLAQYNSSYVITSQFLYLALFYEALNFIYLAISNRPQAALNPASSSYSGVYFKNLIGLELNDDDGKKRV